MRHRPIDLEPWRHEHQVRAFAKRRARRHRRAHAEGPRLIARRDDDAPPRGIADCDRTASQGWIIALLDRRVEGVHVDVDDLACVGFAHGISHFSRMGYDPRMALQFPAGLVIFAVPLTPKAGPTAGFT